MIKKVLFILACVGMLLSISSSTVLAGKGGPPEVITPDDGVECGMWWIKWHHDGTVMVGTLIIGTISYVYHPSTGIWTSTCRYFVDFDNPTLGTIEEMCAVAEEIFPDQIDCTNSTFVWNGFDCWLDDMVTTDSQAIVSADGNAVATCHFSP